VTDFKLLDATTGAPTSLAVVTTGTPLKHVFTITGTDVSRTPYSLQSVGIINDAPGTEVNTGLNLEVNILHRCWSAIIDAVAINNF